MLGFSQQTLLPQVWVVAGAERLVQGNGHVSKVGTLPVAVRFYGLVGDIVGESHLEISLPQDATVADLLQALKDRYGERFWQRVMEGPARVSRFVELIVNGRQVDRGAMETPLASGDGQQPSVINVLVLPPAAGG